MITVAVDDKCVNGLMATYQVPMDFSSVNMTWTWTREKDNGILLCARYTLHIRKCIINFRNCFAVFTWHAQTISVWARHILWAKMFAHRLCAMTYSTYVYQFVNVQHFPWSSDDDGTNATISESRCYYENLVSLSAWIHIKYISAKAMAIWQTQRVLRTIYACVHSKPFCCKIKCVLLLLHRVCAS